MSAKIKLLVMAWYASAKGTGLEKTALKETVKIVVGIMKLM
jgi:hypothetical protein